MSDVFPVPATGHRRPSAYPQWLIRLIVGLVAFVIVLAFAVRDLWIARGGAVGALLAAAAVVVIVDRSVRRVYRALAVERAQQAVQCTALLAQRMAEHRARAEEFTELLYSRDQEIMALNGLVARLSAHMGALVSGQMRALPVASPPPPADSGEIWADAAEAPTVVDLMAWEEKVMLRAQENQEGTDSAQVR